MIIIIEWPDGTWCYPEELEGYVQWMGDDYMVMTVTEEQFEQKYCYN